MPGRRRVGVTNGISFAGMTVLDPAILADLGFSREGLKRGEMIQFAVAAVLGPAAGAWIDHRGMRGILAFGWAASIM